MTEPIQDQSSLVITVPESEPLVRPFRDQFDLSAIRGLPAHITVLWPFADPDDISRAMIDGLMDVFARQLAFEYTLSGLCGFPDVAYLAPSPMESFQRLTRAVTDRFPQYPPYGGAFEKPIPHLTLAQRPPAEDLHTVCAKIFETVVPRLPIQLVARDVTLAVKREGRWTVRESFPLADS